MVLPKPHTNRLLVNESVCSEQMHCLFLLSTLNCVCVWGYSIAAVCQKQNYLPPTPRELVGQWPTNCCNNQEGFKNKRPLQKHIYWVLLQKKSFHNNFHNRLMCTLKTGKPETFKGNVCHFWQKEWDISQTLGLTQTVLLPQHTFVPNQCSASQPTDGLLTV